MLIACTQLILPPFPPSLCSIASFPDLHSQKSEVPSWSQLLIHSKDRLNIFFIWCQLHIYFSTQLSYISSKYQAPVHTGLFIAPGTALGLGQASDCFPLFNTQERYEKEITYTEREREQFIWNLWSIHHFAISSANINLPTPAVSQLRDWNFK